MNRTLLSSVLSFALVSALSADDGKVVLSGGLTFAQTSALDMTHKVMGGHVFEAGYQFRPQDYGVDVHVYAGWLRMPGADPTPDRVTYEMAGPHFGFDLVYKPFESLPLTLHTGPSAHVWQVEQRDGIPQGDQGLKMGWRAGIGYDFTSDWSAKLLYTVTEWRSVAEPGSASRRPAYVSLMASYRF